MCHRLRAGGVTNLGQRPDRQHLAAAIANLQLADIVSRGTKLRLGLCNHLKGPPEQIKVIDIRTAQIGLQRVKYRFERHIQCLGLHPVDIHIQLRHRRPKGIVQLRHHRVVEGLVNQVVTGL